MSKYNIFAYGSNLSKDDWNMFCSSHAADPSCLKFKEEASLPDHHLSFDRFSHTRRGGVLNVQRSSGSVVNGALFEVDEIGLGLLRRKEGVGLGAYEERTVTVIDTEGNEKSALTYIVPPHRIEPFQRPHDEYLNVCLEGYKRFACDTAPLLAAAEGRIPESKVGFFAYGSLMRCEARFEGVKGFGVRSAVMAICYGALYDSGNFPALDISQRSFVAGDFFDIEHLSSFLDWADRVEGFQGFGNEGSLFRRTLVTVDVGGLGQRHAWVYVQDSPALKRIECDDWRIHTRKDADFRRKVLSAHLVQPSSRTSVEKLAEEFLSDTGTLPAHRSMSERALAQHSGKWRALCD